MVFLLFSCPQLRHLEIEDALGRSCALDPMGRLVSWLVARAVPGPLAVVG